MDDVLLSKNLEFALNHAEHKVRQSILEFWLQSVCTYCRALKFEIKGIKIFKEQNIIFKVVRFNLKETNNFFIKKFKKIII